jgi:hypothetical protein
MRKSSRKGMRRSRKTSRRGKKSGMSRRRCWNGGAQAVFPADVNDSTMASANKLSMAQGNDYLSLHEGQHGGYRGIANAASADADYMLEASKSSTAFPGQSGGAAISLASSAPPGYTGMLDDSLRATARIAVLDQSMQGIQGMSDQSGGGRRRRKNMSMRKRKNMVMRKRKSMSMRRRRMRGGATMSPFSQAADFGSPGMLLSPNQEAQALQGMNPEWKLATDPGAFKPAGM